MVAAPAIALASQPCRAPLPAGPRVPAAIVLRTDCGGFLLEPGGRVERLPPRWFARRGGSTGRRFGADLAVRRTRPGAYRVLRDGRLVWRSTGLYRNDGGAVAFGPGAFAFATYRRGVFLTDLRGPERLVARGRGLFPIGFRRDGALLVAGGGLLRVIDADGRPRGRFRYRSRNGFSLDERTDTLFLVHAGRLTAIAQDGARSVGATVPRDAWVSVLGGGLIALERPHGLVLVDRRGRTVASTDWRRSRLRSLDSGVAVAAGGRAVAFRLSDVRPGSRRGRAAVYVLPAGATEARRVYAERLGPAGCAPGATLSWHGSTLLYRSQGGSPVLLDAGTGAARSLARFVRRLPARTRADGVAALWLADYPSPRAG